MPRVRAPAVAEAALAALEPKYHVAYFQLHGDLVNDTALDTPPPLSRPQEIKELYPAEFTNNNTNTNINNNTNTIIHNNTNTIIHNNTDIIIMSPRYSEEEWRQPPRQLPPPRSGHLLLSCPQRRSLILHGGLGVGPIDLLNDTWEYLIDCQRWVQLHCKGEVQQARVSINNTNTRRRRTNTNTRAGEIEIEIEEETEEETQVIDDGMPPKAFGQSGTLFAGGRYLFVHGGITNGDHNILHAFQLDIERRLWRRLRLTSPLPNMWGAVAQTLLIPVKEKINEKKSVKDSGRSTSTSPPSLSLSLSPLQQQEEEEEQQQQEQNLLERQKEKYETSKEGRYVEVVVLFGGMQDNRAFNDTYFLYLATPPPSTGRSRYKEGEKRIVQKLPSLSNIIFPGRRRPCATVCKDFYLFIFGGRDSHYFYNDLWVLNGYTRQWIMVRAETPLRYMQEFFRWPFDYKPGQRIMAFVESILYLKRDPKRCLKPTQVPQRCLESNSSAIWRTGAVMVSRDSDIFIFGGFTYDDNGSIETHKDAHVYNYIYHIWREVHLDEGCTPYQFPAGYFKTIEVQSQENEELLHNSDDRNDNNNNSDSTRPLQKTVKMMQQEENSSLHWEIIKNISSTCPEGRTMAAMCQDPVFPGFRFFMFGGRSEDEPSGELFDVRIRLVTPELHSTSLGYEEVIQQFCEVNVRNSPSLLSYIPNSHQETNNNNNNNNNYYYYYPPPPPYPSDINSILQFPLNPPLNLSSGARSLSTQAADWVRAVLLEESTLKQAAGAARDEDDTIVGDAWLHEAHILHVKMFTKVEEKLPSGLRASVSHALPFLRRG